MIRFFKAYKKSRVLYRLATAFEDADVIRDPEAQVIGHAEDIGEASAMMSRRLKSQLANQSPLSQPRQRRHVTISLTSLTAVGALIV